MYVNHKCTLYMCPVKYQQINHKFSLTNDQCFLWRRLFFFCFGMNITERAKSIIIFYFNLTFFSRKRVWNTFENFSTRKRYLNLYKISNICVKLFLYTPHSILIERENILFTNNSIFWFFNKIIKGLWLTYPFPPPPPKKKLK